MTNQKKSVKNADIKPIEVIKYLFALRKAAPISSSAMILAQIIFIVLTSTIAPIVLAKLLTQIAQGQASLSNSSHLLMLYALILIVGDIIMPRLTLLGAYIAETKMQSEVYQRILTNLTQKSMRFHADHMSGQLVSDATKLYNKVENFWEVIVFTVIPITTTIVAVNIVLAFIIWQYAIILSILSVIVVLSIIKIQSLITDRSRKASEASSKVTAYFADVITNISAVKTFAGEKREKAGHNQTLKNWQKAVRKEMWGVFFVSGGFGVLNSILNIVAFVVAILASEHHVADLATIYLVISYTLNVVSQLWEVGHATRNYIRIVGDASPMIAMLGEPIEITDPEHPVKIEMRRGSIHFNDVTFRYPDNNQILFDGLNLNIKPGEKIGLVGKSGGGKTTLSKLLLRFMDIESGQIAIDGQDITSVRQADLRKRIAYVPQEPMLFHRSITENIKYGKSDATQAEIEAVAKMAHAHEFIKDLPNGYDTLVGERGVKLSGGQRQRIAIARAMLKNAPILVMDEATSALDSESEALIQDALWKLMENRTAIVIAHRLSTIQQMDRIIVMDEGKIVEEGSHKYLVTKNGTYANLWNRQSGSFLEEQS